jgi:AcrR family transcriptional regulator
MSRRDNEKKEMINNIQQASIDIINEEGYEKLSIRKIAARIEYSSTNIYNYFENKGKIIESIIIMKSMDVVVKVEKKLQKAADKSIEEQFELFVRTFIEEMLKEPEQVKAVIQSGYNIFGDYNIEDKKNGPNKVYEFLQMGMAVKAIREDITEPSVILIMTSLLGFISMVVNENFSKKELNVLVDEEVKILWNGIKRS